MSDDLSHPRGALLPTPRRLVMWNGTVRALPFVDQVRAAAAVGCGELSVTPLDWAGWVSSGLGSSELRSIADDHGVRLAHLDPLCRWSDPWHSADSADSAGEALPPSFFAFEVEDFFRIAEAVGATSLTAISVAPAGGASRERLTEDFARLCDQAAERGLVCELEFIPLGWAIPDLSTALSIVRDAGRSNSGVVFDLWHFVRSGSTLAQLRALPRGVITSVQLADASRHVPRDREPADDCLFHRRPVGDGEFPVAEVLKALAEIGALDRVGPEYFSTEFDGMDPGQNAEACRRSMERYFNLG